MTPSIETLTGLLGDPSATVGREVARELRARGNAARPVLRRLARRGDARVRGRARRLLLGLDRERVARRLAAYALRAEPDLERGLLLLSRFEEPRLDARRYLAALDAMGAEVARRVESRPPSSGRALELCGYLGDELGYTGEREDYHHPDNAYLHRVIERKRGLPLTLVALYLLVARRAGLSAAPVALPGHVVLRLHGPDRHLLVDPFRGGETIDERDCLAYLAQHGLPFRSDWFADSDDATLLARQVRNLCNSYGERGLLGEVRQLTSVLQAFDRRVGANQPVEEGA